MLSLPSSKILNFLYFVSTVIRIHTYIYVYETKFSNRVHFYMKLSV